MNPWGPAMLCGSSYLVMTLVTGSTDATIVVLVSVNCETQKCVLLAAMSWAKSGICHIAATPELGRSRRTVPSNRRRATVNASV